MEKIQIGLTFLGYIKFLCYDKENKILERKQKKTEVKKDKYENLEIVIDSIKADIKKFQDEQEVSPLVKWER